MKSQSIQFFLVVMAICALMVNCMPAKQLTDEQKQHLGKHSSWGAQEYQAHGYGAQSNQAASHGEKHSTSGNQSLNVQGLGYQSSHHTSHSGTGSNRQSNHDQTKSAYYGQHGSKP